MDITAGLQAAKEQLKKPTVFKGRKVGCAILCIDSHTTPVWVTGRNYTEKGLYVGDPEGKDRYAYTPHAEIDCLTKMIKTCRYPADPFILFSTASPCLKCAIMAKRMGVRAIVVAAEDPFSPEEYMIREALDYCKKHHLPVLREQLDAVPRI